MSVQIIFTDLISASNSALSFSFVSQFKFGLDDPKRAKAKPFATSTEAACFTFYLGVLLIYNKMTNDDCDSSIFFKVLL